MGQDVLCLNKFEFAGEENEDVGLIHLSFFTAGEVDFQKF